MTLARVAVAAFLFIGCGGGGEPRLSTVKVKGKLLVDDKPFGGCALTLSPSGSTTGVPDKSKPQLRAATAKVASDGSFELTTYEAGDGIAPGKYDVSISSDISSGDLTKGTPVTKPLTVDIQKPADNKPLALELKLEGTGETSMGAAMPGMPAMPGTPAPK